MSQTPILRSIVPILPVQSVARAVAYYQALGFRAESSSDAEEYAFLTRDGLEVHLRRAPDLAEGENPCGVYFMLNPGAAAVLEAAFRDAGVAIASSLAVRAWRMHEFALSDPDGNLLRFGEPA